MAGLKEDWDCFSRNSDYPSYEIMERIKQAGWKLLRKAEKQKSYIEAAHFLVYGPIWAHYWRARMALENGTKYKTKLKLLMQDEYFPKCVLPFYAYMQNWLYSNDERPDLFSDKTFSAVLYNYKTESLKSKYMRKGYTEYFFPEITKTRM